VVEYENMNEKMCKSQMALLKVEQRALELSYVVSVPIVEGERYDCIIDIKNKLLKAQVKYAGSAPSRITGAVQVNLTRQKGRGITRPYNSKEIDVLMVYIPQIDKVCMFSPKIFSGKQGLIIRYKETKNGQKKGCLMAERYIWK
jgi:hypothetical protein